MYATRPPAVGDMSLETVRTVVESFIRLVKAEIDPEAVLVAADDVFEVPRTPSLILQGPTLVENGEPRPAWWKKMFRI